MNIFILMAGVLKQLSAFELKAWLGTTLFVSYLTDVIYGADLRIAKLGYLFLTVLGLVLIVKSEKENKPDYRKIALPLILYLISKYGYSLVIKGFSPYISSTAQLLPALTLISLILLTKVSPLEIYRKNPRGVLTVSLARLPNAAGMLLEKERRSKLNLLGSLLCAIGIILFQFL